MVVPGGPKIMVTRAGGPAPAAEAAPAEPAAQLAAAPEGAPPGPDARALMDEVTAALLPRGVPTRYESVGLSLEQMLAQGWELHQASGAQGGFTMVLTQGSTIALCILVPQQMGESDTALSDCRRLN
jgi:hypothetical protein